MSNNPPQSPQHNTEDKIDAILQTYFRSVVDNAVEKHGETIVEFAERSKLERLKAKADIQQLLREAKIKEAKLARKQWMSAPDDSDFLIANGKRITALQSNKGDKENFIKLANEVAAIVDKEES